MTNDREIGWKATFRAVMKQHNGYKANGKKVVSYATQQQRKEVLLQGFYDLRKMGFKFKTVWAFRGKHMAQLVAQWEKKGLFPATIQTRVSVFRTFSSWIGKRGMILPSERYVSDPKAVRRSYVASEAKTWSGCGVDAESVIKAVRSENERFGDALALQRHFGLRSKESLLLRPHLSDKGHVLIVTHGTKGGRDRYVPIETPEQRALLDTLKGYVPRGESLVPKTHTYAQCRNQYYYRLRKHGITREQGITAHGLRHEHLNALYQQVTGHASPVEGGQLRQVDPSLDSYGRKEVAERAGHSRESIASAYIGGKSSK